MNTIIPHSHPDIEERFLMPEGWRWHIFKNPQGRLLRFGTVAPKDSVPDAVVIGLQGLGEFTEKYFEVARTLLDHNLSFWMLDWQGQGKSHRHLKNTQKRHSSSFDEDITDLHYFLMEYVKHSAVHPDVGRIPLVMLAHSMGGNIGLRYLKDHPDMFSCAAFTAPMIGIRAFQHLPNRITLPLLASLNEVMNQGYVEFGGKEWNPQMRMHKRNDIHTSDPIRKEVHNAWCLHDPALQVGNITYGWLYQAQRSCAKLQKSTFLNDIKTPFLLALAGQEKLVDNPVARKLVSNLPCARLLELPEAKHEILMERDPVRNAFFQAFFEFLQKNNIKEKLKPF
ncbi:MAG: alpha/beta hydrolase [Alphaproteobacteria bacterium CG_4_9_14_3_um_filter_47_13]|nr:MAG: alpha/beta hydrolase [Alphaproteobacteria bacterium CG_4_9_14_3_um_filter_47_13]